MSRILNFFVKGLNHDNSIISDFFRNTLISNSSYMLTNLNTIINRYGINYIDLFNLKKTQVKNIIKNYNEDLDWRCKLVKELLCLREHQFFSNLNQDEINDTLYYVSTFR